MAVKVSEKMQKRLKDVAEWLGMSLVDTEVAMLEIGIAYMEKKKQGNKKPFVVMPSEGLPNIYPLGEQNANTQSEV